MLTILVYSSCSLIRITHTALQLDYLAVAGTLLLHGWYYIFGAGLG